MYTLAVYSHLSGFVKICAKFDFICEGGLPFHPMVNFMHQGSAPAAKSKWEFLRTAGILELVTTTEAFEEKPVQY